MMLERYLPYARPYAAFGCPCFYQEDSSDVSMHTFATMARPDSQWSSLDINLGKLIQDLIVLPHWTNG